MAVRIPGPEALGQLPSLRSGASAARISGDSAVANAFGRVGQATVALSEEARREEEKRDTFEVERRVLEFTRDQERALEEGRREMAPGGAGFADAWRSNYQTAGRQVFAQARQDGLSVNALDRLDVGLLRAGEQYHSRALRHQMDEEGRFHRNRVTEELEKLFGDVRANPGRVGELRDHGRRLIETSALFAADRDPVDRWFRRRVEEEARASLLNGIQTAGDADRAIQSVVGEVVPNTRQTRPRGGNILEPPRQGRLQVGRDIYAFFVDQGLQPHQAAALAGNMAYEGGGRSDAVRVSDNRSAPQAPHSFGIAQWNGPRLAALVDFARSKGAEIPEGNLADAAFVRSLGPLIPLRTQLEFAWSEMEGAEAPAGRGVRGAADVQAAVGAAMGYHRPRGWSRDNPAAGHGFSDRLLLSTQILDAASGQRPGQTQPAGPASVQALGGRTGEPGVSQWTTEVIPAGPAIPPAGGAVPGVPSPAGPEAQGDFAGAAARARALRLGSPEWGLAQLDLEERGEGVRRSDFTSTTGMQARGFVNQVQARRAQIRNAVQQQFTTWETQARDGVPPPPAVVAQVREQVEAFGDPQIQENFEFLVGSPPSERFPQGRPGLAVMVQGLRRLRPDEMERFIQAEEARQQREGATDLDKKRLDHFRGLLSKARTEIERDPNGWAQQVGVAQGLGYDFSRGFSLSDDASMRAHGEAVRAVGSHLGQAPQFFSPEQRQAARGILEQGGQPMLNMLGSIARNWGGDAQRAIRELASADDAPELAMIAQMYLNTGGHPAGMRAVTEAANAIRMRRDDPNVRAAIGRLIPNAERRDAEAVMGATFLADRQSREAAAAVADLIYYQRHRDRPTFDPRLWQQGLREALGETTEGNRTYGGIYAQRRGVFGGAAGGETLMPSNVRQDALPRIWEALRPEDLTGPMGEGPMTVNGTPVSMRALKGMTLVSVGQGRYWIAQGDPASGQALWVTRSRGPADEANRYILDLNALEPTLRQRVPEIYRGYVEPPRTAQQRLTEAYARRVPEADILMSLPGARALPPEQLYEFRRQFVAANPDPERRRAITRDRDRYGAELQRFIEGLPFEPGIDEPSRPGNPPAAPAGPGGAAPQAGAEPGRLERTRQAVGRVFGDLFGTTSSAGVEQTGDVRLAPRATWPTEDEIRQARQSGIGYGTNMERFMSGEEANLYAGLPLEEMRGRDMDDVGTFLADPAVRRYFTRAGLEGQRAWTAQDLERTSQMYTAAQIAGNRAALVGLGLDPGRFVLNTRDRGINLGGSYAYGPMLGPGAGDRGYAGSSRDRAINAPGEALAHEATHRSLQILRTDRRTRGLVDAVMGRDFDEEPTVRLVMWLLAGSPDTSSGILAGGGEPLRRHAEETYQRRDLAHYGLTRVAGEGAFPIAIADRDRVNDLTPVERAVALEIIASELALIRRPGGPR